ncbi:MAG: hypothetical protein ACW96N_03500 [Candidatus Thorarchaeota archaeon]
MQYPSFLKYTFLIHIIIALVYGIMFLFLPMVYIDLVVWPFADLAAARMIGALFLGYGIAAFFGYKAETWEKVEILVLANLVWIILALFGLIWSVVENPVYPVIAYWLNVAISALLLILYLYSYYLARQ